MPEKKKKIGVLFPLRLLAKSQKSRKSENPQSTSAQTNVPCKFGMKLSFLFNRQLLDVPVMRQW